MSDHDFYVSEVAKAKAYVEKVEGWFDKDIEANRKTLETFYLNLALFSGGTFSLSLTYLGYLNNSHSEIVRLKLLIASWACFIATVPLSLFYHTLYSSYITYTRKFERFEALAKKFEAQGHLMGGFDDNLPLEKKQQIKSEFDIAYSYRNESRRCGKYQKYYEHCWRWGGLAAKIFFIAGLVLLFSFASSNALRSPTDIQQTKQPQPIREAPVQRGAMPQPQKTPAPVK
jgi:hypothetical protein